MAPPMVTPWKLIEITTDLMFINHEGEPNGGATLFASSGVQPPKDGASADT